METKGLAITVGIFVVVILVTTGLILFLNRNDSSQSNSNQSQEENNATENEATNENNATNSESNTPSNSVANNASQDAGEPGGFQQKLFENKTTPSFRSSDPSNNELRKAAVNELTITFNTYVGEGSKISVRNDEGKEVTSREADLREGYSLFVPVFANKTGNYEVLYEVCTDDDECEKGSFGFSVQLED